MQKWIKNHAVTSYIVLACSLTWLFWMPTLLIAQTDGYALPFADNYATLIQEGFQDSRHLVVSAVFFLAVYGPLIASLVVTASEKGRGGVASLMKRMVKWRISVKWYGVAIAVNLLMLAIPVVFGVLPA